MTARREYAMAIVAMALASIVIVIAYGSTWVTATVPVFKGEPMPTRMVTLTGSMVVGFGAAAGWLGLASTAGIVATRTWGRSVVGIVAVVAGAAGGIPAVTFILSREPIINQALAGDQAVAVSGNAWWLAAAVGGLVVMGAGLLSVVRGRAWPVMSARYERPVDGEPAPDQSTRTTAVQMWEALDRGEDPT